ncbi:MAG: hypothetical protein V1763_01515 [Parcubacteria group bacterium]
MQMKPQNININSTDNIEKLEEEILEAANKAGKKNVIVNIFSFPAKRLKRRWNIRYKFNKKHLIIDSVVVAGILVLIGLNIFWAYGGFRYFSNNLTLTVSGGADKMLSGQIASFTIHYANDNEYTLDEVVLGIRLPQNFELKNVSAKTFDYQRNVLALGNLAPGANGDVNLSGIVLGGLNDQQNLIVNLTYFKTDNRGQQMWGQFQENRVRSYMIGGSYLSVESALPDKLVNGATFDWPIKIKNTSADFTYENVSFGPDIAEDFKMIVPPSQGYGEASTPTLNVALIKPGEEVLFAVKMQVTSITPEKAVSGRVFSEIGGMNLLQSVVSENKTVLQPNFSVAVKLAKGGAVNPGDPVDLIVSYNNAGDLTLENVELNLEFGGSFWDVAGSAIKFNYKNWPRLALLQPKETGEQKITVQTKTSGAAADVLSQVRLTGQYKLQGNVVDFVNDWVSVKFNSNLSAVVYPLYYAPTGDQLGRGPIPPRVGQETKYWVFVKLVNDLNSVGNVKISMTLGPNVAWQDKSNVPVGDAIDYDATTRSLSWQISEVPVKPENIGFAFMVGVTPDVNQRGTYPLLLKNIKISGIDSSTQETINKNLGDVTTKLIYDLKGKKRDGVAR